MTIMINNPAPSFTGKTDGNGSISLADLRGKNVVIYFYPKDNTPGCTIESCGFRDAYKDFQALNTEIIGVSKDSVASHDRFKAGKQLPFPLLADTDEVVCTLFDVLQEKSMFGKKYMGIERSTFLIDADGIVRNIWRKVSVAGHVKEVLQAVTSLQKKAA